MMMRGIAIAVLSAALCGCVHEVHKAVEGPLPNQRGDECRANCAALGMRLTSVVLIMNSTGCVCQVLEVPPPPGIAPAGQAAAEPAAAAIVGGAAIAATAAAAAQQRQRSSSSSTQTRH